MNNMEKYNADKFLFPKNNGSKCNEEELIQYILQDSLFMGEWFKMNIGIQPEK